jgi:hypothetical protein
VVAHSVIVQVAIAVLESNSLSQLLQRQGRGRVRRDNKMQQSARTMMDTLKHTARRATAGITLP